MHHALVLTPDADDYIALLQTLALPQLQLYPAASVEAAQPYLGQCDIVLGRPDKVVGVLAFMPRLKWVQSTFAGIEVLCQPSLRQDYQLTNVKGIFGPLISEYVLAYVLGLERQLWQARALQQQKQWQPNALAYRSIQGVTIGIAGLGSIGQHLAATAKHFGMQVSGLNTTGQPVADVDKVYTPAQLAEFLADLDYLVLVLPSTPATHHLFNAQTLKLVAPQTVVINVGRGSAIDEQALVNALQTKQLRAAVLDVFEREPLSSDSPLWQLPNVYLTPHIAAQSFTPQIAAIFRDNYQRFLQQQPLQYLVDIKRGY